MSNTRSFKFPWLFLLGLLLGVAVTVGLVLCFLGNLPLFALRTPRAAAEKTHRPAVESLPQVDLVKDIPHTVVVPQTVRDALGIHGAYVVQPPEQAPPLQMPGSTALDPTRLARVRTRFNAEIREIGQVRSRSENSDQTEFRELRTGDWVRKGDILAVVWSSDVGAKKSDLVDALVQLDLDKKRLEARMAIRSSIPEDVLNQSRRDVMADQNTADRAERTLRTWNIPDQEIQAVFEEAEQIGKRSGKRDKDKERLWARSELIAPRDGTIVERNVGIGEYVADNTINLFTIADVDRMLVLANPPEDQLPALLARLKVSRIWSLRLIGFPPIEGRIDDVSFILDANQHTAVVKGYLDNPGHKIRAGQFVTANVSLPPPEGVVEVPLTALAEDGRQSFVLVQTDPDQPRYTLRRVLVASRYETTVFVRSQLTPSEEKLTPQEIEQGLYPIQPLRQGERVITSGVLELRAALDDKESHSRRGP